jgi:hypothetical protein
MNIEGSVKGFHLFLQIFVHLFKAFEDFEGALQWLGIEDGHVGVLDSFSTMSRSP